MAPKAADTDAAVTEPQGEAAHHDPHGGKLSKKAFLGLSLGSMGVVFGDIGTSPLYAMKEALHHTRPGLGLEDSVLGVVSLVLWALTLIVTVKYVIFLMRADNNGEGGTLVLMSLAQRAIGKRLPLFLGLGIVGAALFYGDGVITPAISVLSAVEGIRDAPGAPGGLAHYVVPISAVILIALFMAQAKGTHRMAAFFGPIMCVWFLAIGAIGAMHLAQDITVLRAINPWYGARFRAENGLVGFFVLGSVVLAVTGAEALYADMGHFGRGPIRLSWAAFAFPALALCYLGQAANVLAHPAARANPFWQAIPTVIYGPMLSLSGAATVIASQAVISGAFSLTQQAVQMGRLPRIDIRRTSETQAGQIFVPAINNLLMIGVLVLLFVFQSSSRLAAAYGIAVTGAMFVDTRLAIVVVHRLWKWNWLQTSMLIVPVAIVDLVFISSNLLKIPDGAWLPLVLGGALIIIMWTWTRGTQILTDKTRRDSVPLAELSDILRARAPHRAPGTAIFLTSDPELAPVALLHNLKHNKVLHERNVVLTVKTAPTPRVDDHARVYIDRINADFQKVTVKYGFMESPNLPKALQLCRKKGLKFDIMATSFFLGRRSVVPSATSGMPRWQDRLFIFLMKNAANPTDFFKIPPGRVVELGAQVSV